jgi:site-specific recombinase XerD
MAAGLEARLRIAAKDKLPRARLLLDDEGLTPRRQQVLHQFKRFLHRNGLKEHSFHSLRHYFISELMKCGARATGRQRTRRPSRFRCFSRQILSICRGERI